MEGKEAKILGKLTKGAPLRIWAGEKNDIDNLGILLYRKRLPAGESFKVIRKNLITEIENAIKKTPYDYWISPKAKSIM